MLSQNGSLIVLSRNSLCRVTVHLAVAFLKSVYGTSNEPE